VSGALLVLEDGTVFRGTALGAEGETFGEIVFNTGMSGYQEVLTDPSYAGQIVIMTVPHVGNYGVNDLDPESSRIHVAGFVVREAARRPSSWRAEGSINTALAAAGIVAIEGVDTRALTLHIREAGAMRGGISSGADGHAALLERVRAHPEMAGADIARTVSTAEPYEARVVVGPAVPRDGRTFRVAAFDWGLKRNSLRMLARSGAETVVYPALTQAEEVLKGGYDGVFLSNGPGDPAATTYAIETTRALVSRIPLFGICLGHQVLARAIGGSTTKLKFGHRGINQPVLDMDSGRVEVTSHNHGFAVDARGWGGASPFAGGASLPPPASPAPEPPLPGAAPPLSTNSGEPPVVHTEAGRVALTHWNLNDGTLEGMRLLDAPAFSVQYHPEAAPGPHDSAYLFDRFAALMERSG
jgi:carbamoyl-phosphate synthase small subunit